MQDYEKEMHEVLNALNESHALPHCIVTGSWAMYFIKQFSKVFSRE